MDRNEPYIYFKLLYDFNLTLRGKCVIIFVAVLILINAFDKSRDLRPCLVLVSRALVSFITVVC